MTFKLDPVRQWREARDAFGAAQMAAYEGRHADVRPALLAALEKFGIDVGARPAEVGEGPAHRLLVYGQDQERRVIGIVVPEAAFSDEERRTLDRDFAAVFGETCYDAPEEWRMWARVTLGLGVHPLDAFGPDLEAMAADGIDAPDLAAWVGAWTSRVAFDSHGASDPSLLDVPIGGVTLVHENM